MALPLPTRVNGQTIDQTWFNSINTELVTLDSKHSALVDDGAIVFNCRSTLENLTGYNALFHIKLTQDITLLSALLWIETNGSSGSLEVDVKFKRGAGAWTSVFTAVPEIPFGAGNNADSATGAGATAAIIDSTYDELLAGDLLRVDVLTAPGGTPENFYLELKRENTGS